MDQKTQDFIRDMFKEQQNLFNQTLEKQFKDHLASQDAAFE